MAQILKRGLAWILTMVMLIGMTACGGNTPTSPSDAAPGAAASLGTTLETKPAAVKDTLVVAIPGEPTTLDPYAHSLYYGFLPATLIFDTLLVKNADGSYAPGLATEWKMVDDLTLEVKLRSGVKFHNGNAFTAEDVKFTLATAAASSFSNTLFACIDNENTKVVDDTTITVKLKYAYAPLLEVLASFRASIIDKESYEQSPDAYGRTPNGTGPMKVTNWYASDRIELGQNDGYWGTPVSFKTCVFRVIVEASSRTIELETGGIDIAVDVPFSDWSRIESAPTMKLEKGKTNLMASLVFNMSNDLFKDIKIRQALAYGLNMDALVKTVWEGTAEVADSYYAPSMLGYKKEGPMGYDVDKAKALLAEAGYPNGLEFTYTTYQTNLNQAFAEVLQNMWAQIGVTLKIDIVDLATFTGMNNNGQLTASLMTPNVPIADPAAALILWPINRTISLRHGDQHIQDLLDAGSSNYDEAKRVQIYQELQDYLFANTYTVPVAYTTFAFGVGAGVQGFTFDPSQVPNLKTVSVS